MNFYFKTQIIIIYSIIKAKYAFLLSRNMLIIDKISIFKLFFSITILKLNFFTYNYSSDKRKQIHIQIMEYLRYHIFKMIIKMIRIY